MATAGKLVPWALVAIGLLTPSTKAGFAFQTSSDPAHWQIGREETVSVWINEAALPHPLVFAGMTVEFESSLLGSSNAVAAGEIVPTPTWDATDFLAISGLGLVDASFATASSDPAFQIVSPGRFVHFTVTPVAEGAGSLRMVFAQAMYVDEATGDLIDANLTIPDAMPFRVTVPAAGLSSFGVTGLGMLALRRRAVVIHP